MINYSHARLKGQQKDSKMQQKMPIVHTLKNTGELNRPTTPQGPRNQHRWYNWSAHHRTEDHAVLSGHLRDKVK